MRTLIDKARVLLCAIIVVSFALPGYAGYSALSFLSRALSETKVSSGVTELDAFILLAPLLLIPVTAIGIGASFVAHRTVARIYLAMPLVFFVFFMVLLFRSPGMTDAGIGQLQIGFYTTVLAACGLPFTKDPKRKSRRRRRRSIKKTELAA